MDNKCYVYLHKKPDTDEVFYVGKGTQKKRAYRNDGRNQHWHRVVKKYGKKVEIFKSELEENLAFYLERFLIKIYGKQLVNKTEGGEGTLGFKHTEQERKNRRDRKLGKPRPDMAGENSVFKKYPHLLNRMTGILNPMKNPVIAEKNAAAKRGRKNKRISDVQRGVPKPWQQGDKHWKATSIMCIETGKKFSYVNEAVNWLKSIGNTKATHTSLTKCCKELQKSAYGYTWKYIES